MSLHERLTEEIRTGPSGPKVVRSNEGRDTMALREFLVSERRLGEVLYANPDADVTDVLRDALGGEVLAAVYEEGGLTRYHHLRPLGADVQRWLESWFPDQRVHITSSTADRRHLSVLVTGATNPGSFYWVDAEDRRTIHLGERLPRVAPDRLAATSVLEVVSGDGTRLEAFLTLPREHQGDLPPLVVVPHGGPIGIRDGRDFDPDVQYLAAAGFAVLKVNYRGSGGYGRSFEEAGKGQWGEGIEDDIEAAVDRVVADGAVDPERICIAGGSYGGYSALIGVTRRPQRYRCAASIAGPTDLLLMFESSDFAATEEGRRAFAEIVGDPDAERERLIRISPAYRATEIDVPVLLAHGEDDRRVDIEHAYRMKAMLEATGADFEWMLLEGGHAWTRRQRVRFFERLDRFLSRHLASGELRSARQ